MATQLELLEKPFNSKALVWHVNESLNRNYQMQRNDFYNNRKRKR